MHKYIIDVNLPCGVFPFDSEDCIHVSQIDSRLSDSNLWKYAKENGLTIVSKDADFYNRILVSSPPPKVIHVRFGNMKLKQFITTMEKLWPIVMQMSQTHKLVSVFADKVEALD